MGILDLFKKKKKVEKLEETKREEPSLLEQLCGEDKALYEDLSWCMYLDPRGKGTSEEAMREAEKYERKGDKFQAWVTYVHYAGPLALWEGNVERVKEAFDRAAKLPFTRKYERLREVPEEAVRIAQEYYKRKLVPLEKEKKTLQTS